jgi:NADPH:quinone reductase-like Zn-dependent oxidoreductase
LAIELIAFGDPAGVIKVTDVPEPAGQGAGDALIWVEYARFTAK